MLEAMLAVSAIVPSALLVWYFHARDVFPEPPRVLWTTFLLGALTVLPIGIIEIPVDIVVSEVSNPFLAGTLRAFGAAAIPEELLKLGVLLFYSLRSSAFDEPMDGIVYGVVASLGFATIENLLYVFDGGLLTAAVRAVTAVPLHAFVGVILGYYVGQSFVQREQKRRLIWTGYGAAVALHGWYDMPLLTMESLGETPLGLVLVSLSFVALLFSWRWAIRVTRRLHLAQRLAPAPSSPVAAGTPQRPRRRRLLVLQIIVSGLVATVGGMLSLGVLLGFFLGLVAPEHLWSVITGGVIIGGLPLVLGVAMFAMGIRRLNAAPPKM